MELSQEGQRMVEGYQNPVKKVHRWFGFILQILGFVGLVVSSFVFVGKPQVEEWAATKHLGPLIYASVAANVLLMGIMFRLSYVISVLRADIIRNR